MLIDTHAHLDYSDFSEDLEDGIARSVEAGVTRIITIGTGIESSARAIAWLKIPASLRRDRNSSDKCSG